MNRMTLAKKAVIILSGTGDWSATLPAVTPTLGAELLTDPGLEAWNNATTLTSYTQTTPAGSSINRDTDKYAGTYDARMDLDATNPNAYFLQAVTLAAGSWAQVSAYLKASVAGKVAAMGFSAATPARADQPALTTGYLPYVQTQRSTNANPNAIFARSSAASASLFWDSLSVKLLTLSTLYQTKKCQAVNGIYTNYPTRALITQAGVIHWANATNFVLFYLDGTGNLRVEKYIGGAWQASVASVAVTYVAAAPLVVQRSGVVGAGSYAVSYNGSALAGSPFSITDAVMDTAPYWGNFSTYAANTFGQSRWTGPH